MSQRRTAVVGMFDIAILAISAGMSLAAETGTRVSVPGSAYRNVTVATLDDRARLGEPVVVVGFPEGQRLGIFGGIVSQLPLSELQEGIAADQAEHRIVIDAAAPAGVSGGGVFDVETGHLIGIVQGHETFSITVKDRAGPYALKFPVQGETFVVPMTQIRSFLTTPEVANELPGAVTSALVSPAPG